MPETNTPTTKSHHIKPLTYTIKNLSNAELLAFFITNPLNDKTTIDLAHAMLKQFGSIRNLFSATEKQLCACYGFNKNSYTLLQAAIELSQRHLEEQLIDTDIISDVKTAYLYLAKKLRDHKREVFACLFLNNQNHAVHYEELFHGTINTITVYPREIVKTALQHNACAVILAHNHPSGLPIPSAKDKNLTKMLIKILNPLCIKVLDHIIIGHNSYASLMSKNSTP